MSKAREHRSSALSLVNLGISGARGENVKKVKKQAGEPSINESFRDENPAAPDASSRASILCRMQVAITSQCLFNCRRA